jgi:hypothetical protein
MKLKSNHGVLACARGALMEGVDIKRSAHAPDVLPTMGPLPTSPVTGTNLLVAAKSIKHRRGFLTATLVLSLLGVCGAWSLGAQDTPSSGGRKPGAGRGRRHTH